MDSNSGHGMPISRLLDFSLMPIAKVLVMCALGAIMASPKINILTASARKQLSQLVFSLFLPCLIFTQLGTAVTIRKMLEWWFIPVNVVIANILGCLLGWLVAILVKPPPEFFKLTIVMIGIGNIGNIPLVLLGAVCRDDENPFGDSETCNSNAIAYISFGQWVGAVVAYTFVMRMLAPPKQMDNLTEPLLDKEVGKIDYGSIDVRVADEKHHPELESAPVNGSRKLNLETIGRKVMRTLKLVMQPAVNASILAIVVGTIPFLKNLFLNEDGALFFLSDGLNIMGSAMVPCIMLVLGGNLSRGPGASGLGVRTTVAITVVRLTFTPLIGLFVVGAADKMHLLPAQDKLFRFVLLLQHSMPSSILAGTVASLQGHGEREISAVLFWEHLLAVFSMTGWLLFFLNRLF